MQSLKPTGLPPQNSRRRAMKRIISIGVESALSSLPKGDPRRLQHLESP
jgi:hypothetical protein